MKALKLIAVPLLLAGTLAFSACSQLDVVEKHAISSFEELVTKNSDRVSYDASTKFYTFKAPSGDKFSWNTDFTEKYNDLNIKVDASDFIKAGLDVSKLPTDLYQFDKTTNTLTLPFELGKENFGDKLTAAESFEKIIKSYRSLIGYHEKLDHYGIALGNGNKFEWAKDMSKNDKDIVLVLNPEPLIKAGLDPKKLTSWKYMEVEEAKNKSSYKLLQPADLK